jgi:hypothetical protein
MSAHCCADDSDEVLMDSNSASVLSTGDSSIVAYLLTPHDKGGDGVTKPRATGAAKTQGNKLSMVKSKTRTVKDFFYGRQLRSALETAESGIFSVEVTC